MGKFEIESGSRVRKRIKEKREVFDDLILICWKGLLQSPLAGVRQSLTNDGAHNLGFIPGGCSSKDEQTQQSYHDKDKVPHAHNDPQWA